MTVHFHSGNLTTKRRIVEEHHAVTRPRCGGSRLGAKASRKTRVADVASAQPLSSMTRVRLLRSGGRSQPRNQITTTMTTTTSGSAYSNRPTHKILSVGDNPRTTEPPVYAGITPVFAGRGVKINNQQEAGTVTQTGVTV